MTTSNKLVEGVAELALTEQEAAILKAYAPQAIALIIATIKKEMGNKYHFVQYREFLVADKKMPIEHNQRQAQSYVQGYNQAHDEFTTILDELESGGGK